MDKDNKNININNIVKDKMWGLCVKMTENPGLNNLCGIVNMVCKTEGKTLSPTYWKELIEDMKKNYKD